MTVRPDWVQVYQAAHAMEAELLVGLLHHHGIDAGVKGTGLTGGIGELPADAIQMPIWVPAQYYSDARKVLDEYEANQKSTGSWQCAQCGELNDDSFELCWQCGNEVG